MGQIVNIPKGIGLRITSTVNAALPQILYIIRTSTATTEQFKIPGGQSFDFHPIDHVTHFYIHGLYLDGHYEAQSAEKFVQEGDTYIFSYDDGYRNKDRDYNDLIARVTQYT